MAGLSPDGQICVQTLEANCQANAGSPDPTGGNLTPSLCLQQTQGGMRWERPELMQGCGWKDSVGHGIELSDGVQRVINTPLEPAERNRIFKRKDMFLNATPPSETKPSGFIFKKVYAIFQTTHFSLQLAITKLAAPPISETEKLRHRIGNWPGVCQQNLMTSPAVTLCQLLDYC
ncbi:hypothetical protein AAES_154668 [Amazona aestiva]|uniref:Uncharacterized protein n=1 Tax=Amazona aestiva TaxID=12930 RepID=A0A0Q3UPZ5_AMAAE|nr:hypothetical protein AAES_154668 [Amazona aestiva]